MGMMSVGSKMNTMNRIEQYEVNEEAARIKKSSSVCINPLKKRNSITENKKRKKNHNVVPPCY